MSARRDPPLSLQPGTRLGPYEVIAPIAAGGMGEVYRARDTRLHRAVALKILPSVLAAAPERIERFAREARAAAAINHPNILAVYDVGTESDPPFLVSELLEGDTLRDLSVPGRPWPVLKVLDVAVHVARGVAAAHTRGIVHRDLKPENIFVTDDGVVKILDFGLARLSEPVEAANGATPSVTRDGTVLGTVGYMAPEQVRGQTADQRADIFSFGAVVYELLSGQRAFVGDSSADIMTAVLTGDPPNLTELEATIPRPLARIVARCLEKRPDARFQSASDLAFALDTVSMPETLAGAAAPTTPGARTLARRTALAGLAGLAVLALPVIGYLAGVRAAPQSSAPIVPRVHRLTGLVGLEEAPAMSPDGKSVAYTSGTGGERQIFVRFTAGGPSLQLTHAPGDHQLPRWTADSSSIVFFSPAARGDVQGALWEISALGGLPRRVTDSLGGADASRRNGRLAYFRLRDAAVDLVTSSGDGSDVRTVARLPSASYYWYPRWSPDAKWIAFQRGDGVRFDVFAIPAIGGESRRLTRDNTLINGFCWLPDSAGVVYSSSRESTMPYLPTFALWEARFGDDTSRQLTGHDVSYVHPDVHTSGLMVVGRMHMAFDIWKFPIEGSGVENVGRSLQVTRQTAHVQTPTVSPDGSEVAFLSDVGGHANLWAMAVDGGGLRQITFERDPAVAVGVPVWSPDGKSIAFVSSRGNTGLAFGIWLVDPDGGHPRQLVPRGLGAAWSSDGRWLYFVERADAALRKVPAEGGSVITVRSESTRNVIGVHGSTLYYTVERPLVDGRPEFEIQTATPEDGPSRLLARVPASRVASWQIVNPALSPDGRWLAQALTDGFTTNIWALSTESGAWRQITDFGERVTFIARRVCWSPDGRFILAAIGDGDADIVLLEGLIKPHRTQ